MKRIHLKRALFWSGELTKTLVKFWLKHPEETPAIFRFIYKKATAIPVFMDKNVHTEKQNSNYKQMLEDLKKIYNLHQKDFNLKDPKSYVFIAKKLKTKQQILYFLIRKIKPRVIVETGVAAGESSGYILQAIKDNGIGKLYSIDLPFQWYIYGKHELHLDSLPPGTMPGYLIPDDLKSNWILILGNTYDELPKLMRQLKLIDIFFHDSEHTYKTMLFEFQTALPYINKNGFLLSDDTNFTQAFDEFTSQHRLKKILFKKLGELGISFKA